MITKDMFMVSKIQQEALDRMQKGLSVYGVFDPTTDPRNIHQEMIDELLDVMNYAAMQILRLKILKDRYDRQG